MNVREFKSKPKVGIYKITSPSGRVYIGQSWDLLRRFGQYKNKLGAGQMVVNQSLIKYGYKAHSFDIVHELPSDVDQYTLDIYEVLYWQQYKDAGIKMMNIREPGKGGRMAECSKSKISASKIGKKRSRETVEKILATKKERGVFLKMRGSKGRKLSEEARAKILEKAKGRIKSQETRLKTSISLKGRKMNPESVRKSAEARRGRPSPMKGIKTGLKHTPETLAIISAANKGKKLSEEHGKKFFGWNRVPIIQLTISGEFIKEWPSAKEAARSLGFDAGSIRLACKGEYKQANGYLWRYKNDPPPNNGQKRKSTGKKQYVFISPNGESVNVFGLSPFCKENNLSIGAMWMLSKGQISNHQGWRSEASLHIPLRIRTKNKRNG